MQGVPDAAWTHRQLDPGKSELMEVCCLRILVWTWDGGDVSGRFMSHMDKDDIVLADDGC